MTSPTGTAEQLRRPRAAAPEALAGTGREGPVAATVRGMFGRDSIYLLLWVVQLGMAALFTPISTRLLGPGRFGLVAASIAIMQVLVAVAGIGLQNAVQRRYAVPGGHRDAQRLVTVAIAVSLVTFAVADLTGPAWSQALGLGPYPLAVRYAVAWASLTAISNAALGLLRSRDQLLPFATISLMQSVVAEGLSLALVLFIGRRAHNYILGQLIAQAAAVAVALAVARPLLVRRRDLGMVGDALRFALPLVPALLAAFVLEASDRLVLQRELGSVPVARYAVAYNIGAIPILALGALNMVWMPRVFALADARVRDSVLAQSRDALYALLVPIVMGLGIGAPVLLHIWAPPTYAPNSLRGVVAIIAVSSFAVAGGMSHTRTLLAGGRTLPVALAATLAAALNLLLNLALVPYLRITGSALATLISYIALHAMLAAAAGTVTRLRMPRPALLIAVAVAVAAALGAARLPVTFTFLAVRGAVALVCLIVFGAMVLALAGGTVWPPARRIGRPLISRLVLGMS